MNVNVGRAPAGDAPRLVVIVKPVAQTTSLARIDWAERARRTFAREDVVSGLENGKLGVYSIPAGHSAGAAS